MKNSIYILNWDFICRRGDKHTRKYVSLLMSRERNEESMKLSLMNLVIWKRKSSSPVKEIEALREDGREIWIYCEDSSRWR